jgi:hypothetical protein
LNTFEVTETLGGIWGAFQMVFHIIVFPLHQLRIGWGATKDELSRKWLGDDLVPNPRAGFTHGITIKAPIQSVWPWLAQIGQNKAGFYSYEALENMVGCQIHNADSLHPEWVSVHPGDELILAPGMGFPIRKVIQGSGILCHGMMDADKGQPVTDEERLPPNSVNISWLFCLTEVDKSTTRFISRWRVEYTPGFKNDLLFGRWLLEPIATVMDLRMLRGMKRRAEGRK